MNKIFKVEWDRSSITELIEMLGQTCLGFLIVLLTCFVCCLIVFVTRGMAGDKYAICKLPNGDIVEGTASYKGNGISVNANGKTYTLDSSHCVVIKEE